MNCKFCVKGLEGRNRSLLGVCYVSWQRKESGGYEPKCCLKKDSLWEFDCDSEVGLIKHEKFTGKVLEGIFC